MIEYISEQTRRQEAVRRFLEGDRPADICRDLGRSRSWLYKWVGEYRRHPETDFADGSRAPHTCRRKLPPEVVAAVVRVRLVLEAGDTPDTRYGLIGHRSVQRQLQRLGVQPVPSLATIQRILAAAGLTHPRTGATEAAYYPELVARAPNQLWATDIITRHLHGGEVIQSFHTFDHFSHLVHLSQYRCKTTDAALQHLLDAWQELGFSAFQQFDNEDCFTGGHTHPRVIGRVVRLCLFVGVRPVFIPLREPQRNYWIEGFNSLWAQSFWSRRQFGSLSEVRAEIPFFLDWYHHHYRPPSLGGKTLAEMLSGFGRPRRLTLRLRQLIPDKLPITAGQIHIIRKVDPQGEIRLLNETWSVGKQLAGQYVWTIVDTAQQSLTVWHQPSADQAMLRVHAFPFKLGEPVVPLRTVFHRRCPRCLEHWSS